jgi:hypothetical protein
MTSITPTSATRRPSSTIRRVRRTIGAGLALGALALVTSAPASAASYPVGGGTTSLRLDAGTAGALTSLGVAVHRVGPATKVVGGFRFPVTGGRIDGDSVAGNITHSGGLLLRAGATRVTLTDYRIITTGSPRIVGKVNGSAANVPLFSLDLSKADVDRVGLGTRASGVVLKLHPRGAAALRAAFGTPAFANGLRMGVATVIAKPRDAVFTGGATELAVDAGAVGALTSLGITPSAEPNATVTTAGAFSFPITGGSANLTSLAGSIPHTGGITLTKGATVVKLTDYTIDTVRGELWGKVNGGEPVALFKLDLTAPAVSTGARLVTIGNVKANFTAGAAAALNGAFATTAFTEGLLFGTATVKGRTA